MKTVLIKEGLIYDGLGNVPFLGDIFIEDEKIIKIESNIQATAHQVIDANGMAVTPGFIDIHRHCDAKPFGNDRYGEVMLAQGITTTVVGNCGISLTPASLEDQRAKEMYAFHEPVLGPMNLQMVRSYEAYRKALDHAALPVNFASMIGTGSVKIAVKGFADTPYTEEEMRVARALIEDAMKAGAAGVSLGIMYLPECYSSLDEFARLLEPVGRYAGVVTAHIRGEGDSLVESVKEILEIGRRAGCAVEISHFKSCGMKNWRKEIHKAIALIEDARRNGQDVTCDFYPYTGGSTALTTMVPPLFVQGDMKAALERMGTVDGVEELRIACSKLYEDWDNFAITLGWDRILISGVVKEENQKFIGKTVEEAAKRYGFEDAVACAAYLMNSEEGRTAIINMSMCQEDIDTVAKLEYSLVVSDSIYADTATPHPRMFGAFPKIIREYVLERSIYTLEEAVKKMTSLPARRMKIEKRGRLEPGCYADINIFDPTVFRDHATFSDPAKLATGLSWCLINGKTALKDGVVQCSNSGRNLRCR